jgi:hypothetical protein
VFPRFLQLFDKEEVLVVVELVVESCVVDSEVDVVREVTESSVVVIEVEVECMVDPVDVEAIVGRVSSKRLCWSFSKLKKR